MKSFMRNWIVMTAILVFSSMAVWADSPDPGGSNQLMKKSGSWYEKAAEKVGPADGMAGKKGGLLILQEGSSVYMEGNSTLHKYQMTAHVLKGSLVLKGSSKDMALALKKGKAGHMTFVVPLSTFKSKESGLDDNAYKALKSTEYPEIKFVLTSETLKAGATAGAYVMTANGKLTISGVTVPLTLTANVTVVNNQVRVQGMQKLKFTDFKIKPPSASILIATITCSDDFEVHYDVLFGPAAK